MVGYKGAMKDEEYDPFDIEKQETEKKAQELSARLERESEEADFKWLMSSRRGRRIVWRFLDQAGVFRSSFNPTAMQMAFNEGYRSFGTRTLIMVHQYCPDLYPQMMKENSHARTDKSANREPNQ
jgi:hypothetical protein